MTRQSVTIQNETNQPLTLKNYSINQINKLNKQINHFNHLPLTLQPTSRSGGYN